MKKAFPGYYRPTEDEFSELWRNCLFVLDANVLLNLYRYAPETSKELIGILEEIADRLWVPHQTALEYQRNRLSVIGQQAAAYDDVQKQLHKTQDDLQKALRSLVRPGRHPVIGVDSLLEGIKNIFMEFEEDLDECKREQLDLLDKDHIRDAITVLLEGKVGFCYSSERMDEIYEEGKTRYEREIPPGYIDVDKEGTRQYGDLVLWLQIIDKAKEAKKHIILVTDDRKDDWWWRPTRGKTIAPRPELIEEMLSQAGVSFYMYQADQFMEHAREYLERQVKQGAIDEVREVRLRDEEYMKAAQAEVLRAMWEKAAAAYRLPNEALRAMWEEAAAVSAKLQLPYDALRVMEQEMASRLGKQAAEQLRAMEEAAAVAAKLQLPYETLRAMREAAAVAAELQFPSETLRRMDEAIAAVGAELRFPSETLRKMDEAVAAVTAELRLPEEITESIINGGSIPLDSEPKEVPDESDEQPETGDE